VIWHGQQPRLGAKGAMLLGVRAVLAVSFEGFTAATCRHGRLAARAPQGQTWQSIGVTEKKSLRFSLGTACSGTNARGGGSRRRRIDEAVAARTRIDTPVELEYYRNGAFCRRCCENC